MKRIITALFTAAILVASVSANAAPWITVSSWAYNSVSNFKNAGLLPDSFDNVDDYTQSITRVQLAELLRSALVKAGCMKYEDSSKPYNSFEFTDTENSAAAELAGYNIMKGEPVKMDKVKTGTGTQIKVYNSFYPDRLLTREEMAAVIYRAADRFSSHMIEDARGKEYTAPSDNSDISEWARESVYTLQKANIIAGMGDGSFAPKNNLTIEQAIQVIFALYNEIPATQEKDGANLRTEGEQLIKTFENGLTETKDGDMLYLKNGDLTLLQFETDIYSYIYSATVNGIVYAAAQNVHNRTDFYNAETGEILFQINAPVYKLTDEYIITKSANAGALTFGVCDFSGTELLPPEYSLAEIDEIKSNGWIVPNEEKQAASGWIYYMDSDDHHIYKIDSNGENKQLVSAHTVNDGSVKYLNGRVYFLSGGLLISVNPDGSDERTIKLPKCYNGFLEKRQGEYYFMSDNRLHTLPDYNDSEYIGGKRIMSRISHRQKDFCDAEAIYLESWDNAAHSMGIYRVTLSGGGLNMKDLTEGRHVTDYRTKDGKLYFIDKEPSSTDEDGYAMYGKLYCTENGRVKLICDRKVDFFNFYNGEIAASIVEGDIHNPKYYLMNLNGGNMRLWGEYEELKDGYEANDENASEGIVYTHIYEDLSDENYTVYEKEWSYAGGIKNSKLYFADKDGNETLIYEFDDFITPDKRIGNTIYYNTTGEDNESRSGALHSYNMDTREDSVVATEVKGITFAQNEDGRDWLTYTDYNGNIWRYNGADSSVSEIFPCREIKKRGTLQSIAYIDGKFYKVDTEGNYSLLTEDNMYFDYVYVENGSLNGVGFFG